MNWLKQNWILLAILLVATAMRLYNLTAISLWHDEAFSALLINYPWHEMMYRIGLDVHPPAYYIALRLWADVLGHSMWSLRGFSAFFGIGAVWATYLFAKEAFGRKDLALTAALLMAVNPFQVNFVTEARMYTFGMFFLMVSAYALVAAFRAQKNFEAVGGEDQPLHKKFLWQTVWYWLLFTVSTAITIYTHYYLFFSALAVGLYGLWYLWKHYGWDWKGYAGWVGSYLVVFASYVPWVKTFVFQFNQVQANYWIPPIDRWSVPLTNYQLLVGTGADATQTTTQVVLVVAALVSLYIIYRVARREESEAKWLVLLALVVPFVCAVALSVKRSLYEDRYFVFAALFYTVSVAMFAWTFQRKWVRYGIVGIVVVVSVFNWWKGWADLDMASKPGMAGAAAYLNANVAPQDKLYVGSSFEFFNFKYYNQTGIAPLLYTPGMSHVDQLPNYSGTALLSDRDLLTSFSTSVVKGDHVWLLWTNGFGGSKPTVPASWVQFVEQGYPDVRPYVGTTIYVDEYLVQ
jgi:uncharacterized membrane protein